MTEKEQGPMADYWTTNELASRANLSQARIRQLIAGGDIQAVKFAGTWFIEIKVAQNWLMRYGSKNQPDKS